MVDYNIILYLISCIYLYDSTLLCLRVVFAPAFFGVFAAFFPTAGVFAILLVCFVFNCDVLLTFDRVHQIWNLGGENEETSEATRPFEFKFCRRLNRRVASIFTI